MSRLSGEPTGVALIVVDAAGENQIAVGAGRQRGARRGAVRAALEPRLAGLGCVLVSTEIPDEAVLAAVDARRPRPGSAASSIRRRRPPAVDESIGRGAILTPNAGELEELLGRLGEPEPVGRAPTGVAGRLSRLNGAPAIVTLGGDGVLVVSAEGGQIRAAALRRPRSSTRPAPATPSTASSPPAWPPETSSSGRRA